MGTSLGVASLIGVLIIFVFPITGLCLIGGVIALVDKIRKRHEKDKDT